MMTHFDPAGSGLFQHDSVRFYRAHGSVDDLIIMKNDVNHLLRLSQLIDLNQI